MSRPAPTPGSRRGGVYVLVLVTVAVVATMMVASLDIVRARLAEGAILADSAQAWQYAESGIEAGIHIMQSDPAWRWTRGDGAWLSDEPYGNGFLTLEATGADGSTLAADAWQSVRLTAIARNGRARAIMSVDLGMQGGGFPGAGAVLAANSLLGYWPLADGASSWATDRIAGNNALNTGDSADFRPGAVPGLGAASAPWFSDDAELELDYTTRYNSVRSVSVWAFAEDVETERCIAVRDGSGYDAGSFYLSVRLGALYGGFESNSGMTISAAPITAGEWHHIVLVAEDWTVVLYIDGVEADRTPAPTTGYWSGTDSNDILLGNVSSSAGSGTLSGASTFRGSIHEFAIMGEALTASEVLALYNSYPAPAEYKILADSWNREVR